MSDHEQVAQKIVRAHFLLSDGTGIGATLEAAFATALRAAVAEENEACAMVAGIRHAGGVAAAIRARMGGGK